MDIVCVNGAFVPKAEATVSLFDHGYLYGDGVFEGIRVYNGRVFRLEPHITRLLHSAKALHFEINHLTVESVCAAVLETCRRNDHHNGYIRVTLTRGTGLGLDPAHIDLTPSLIIANQQLALHGSDAHEIGLTMITCATRVPSPDTINPRIKCTGKYINNILAKLEANRAGAGEGMMLNTAGYVAEATGENLFLVQGDIVVTPPPSAGCLKGITRRAAMEIVQNLGLTMREENLTPYDVYTADECFLTGTAAEIVPVITLDHQPIGSGNIGGTTRRVMELFRQETQETGTPV